MPPAGRGLSGLGGVLLPALLAVGVGIAVGPAWLRAWMPAPVRRALRAARGGGAPDVASLLPAGTVLERAEEAGGAVRAVVRVADDPDAAAEAVAERARAAGLEAHVSVAGGLDARVRLLGPRGPAADLLLVPPPAPIPRRPHPHGRGDRPLLAVVLTGLGRAPPPADLPPLPLTVAVRAGSPWALLAARRLARRWAQVLAEPPPGWTAAEALAAVPDATGLWLPRQPALDAPPGLLIVHRARFPAPAGRAAPALAARTPGWAGALDALARARAEAARTGAAAVAVPVDAPELDAVLAWAARAEDEGFRLVLASEAARAEEVRGRPWRRPR